VVEVSTPELGESVVEGTISEWLVAEGDRVQVDQPLVEITTDKVDVEIPSPVAGIIAQILVPEGATIVVGQVLVEVQPEAAPAPTQAAAPTASPAPPPTPPGATPVARRLAEAAQLDLAEVRGTGGGGRITKSDVLKHVDEPEPSPGVAVPKRGERSAAPPAYATYSETPEDRVVPLTPHRRLIAEHMVYSKRTSPHVGTVAEVDFGAVARLRGQQKQAFLQAHGIKLTYLPFVVHAVVRALREFPRLNASWMGDHIVEKQEIHVGLAVETEKGLVVPVVRHADRLSLTGIALAIEDLGGRARTRKLSPDDLRGGSFTISNPGRSGNLYGFAIINQPQVGILRMGEIVKRPVVRTLDGEDALVIRPIMMLALSYDHRVVDGAPANAFLHRIGELLEAADVEF
jgi:2-oxoglutarate dehydrogenase E2 component (dihydrolipoamide succinyltransferase)